MIEILNIVLMLATIVFGAIGWFAPRFAMARLDLKPDGSTLGLSEIRAANGALFVGLGIAALAISAPLAFLMVGFAYAGAAVGRLTSIIFDLAREPTAFIFVAVEIVFAVFLVAANLPATGAAA